jgi:hypothetical protein
MNCRLRRTLLPLTLLLFLAAGSVPSYAGTQKKSGGNSSTTAKSSDKAKSTEKKEKKSGNTGHVKKSKPKDATKGKTRSTTPAYSLPKSSTSRSDRCDNCDRDKNGRIARSGKAKKQFKSATGVPERSFGIRDRPYRSLGVWRSGHPVKHAVADEGRGAGEGQDRTCELSLTTALNF